MYGLVAPPSGALVEMTWMKCRDERFGSVPLGGYTTIDGRLPLNRRCPQTSVPESVADELYVQPETLRSHRNT
jgi:hypothetical protein